MDIPELEDRNSEEARVPRIPDMTGFINSIIAYLDDQTNEALESQACCIFDALAESQVFINEGINNGVITFQDSIGSFARRYDIFRRGKARKECKRFVTDEMSWMLSKQKYQALLRQNAKEPAPKEGEWRPPYEDFEAYDHLDRRDPPRKIHRRKPVYIEQLRSNMKREVDTVVLPREDNPEGRTVAINRLRDVFQSRIRHAFVARSVVSFEQVQSEAAKMGLGTVQLEDENGEILDLRAICKLPAQASYKLEMRLNQTIFSQSGFEVETDDSLGITSIADAEGDIGRLVICYTSGRPNGYALFINAAEGGKLDDSLNELSDMKRLLSNKGVLVQVAERMLRGHITIDEVLLKRLAVYLDRKVASVAGHKKSDRVVHALTVDPELRKEFIDNIQIFFTLLAKTNAKSKSARMRAEKVAVKKGVDRFQREELERAHHEVINRYGERCKANTIVKQEYPITRGIPRQPRRQSRELEENPELARFAHY